MSDLESKTESWADAWTRIHPDRNPPLSGSDLGEDYTATEWQPPSHWTYCATDANVRALQIVRLFLRLGLRDPRYVEKLAAELHRRVERLKELRGPAVALARTRIALGHLPAKPERLSDAGRSEQAVFAHFWGRLKPYWRVDRHRLIRALATAAGDTTMSAWIAREAAQIAHVDDPEVAAAELLSKVDGSGRAFARAVTAVVEGACP